MTGDRRAFLLSLAGALTAGRAQFARAQTPGTLKLTIGGAPILPYTASFIAGDKNYYADVGLTVEHKTIFATDVARTALTAGDIDVAAMAIDSLARAHVAGFDWKILYPAVLYDPARPDADVVVRSDVPVSAPKELEGRTIAVPLGSMGEAAFKAWVNAGGGDWTKVNIVEVPFPQMLAALQAKRIEGAYMVEPGLTQALEAKAVKIVGPNLDIVGGRFLIAVYVARDAWITANADKAKRFVEAVGRATQFALDHPDEALPLVASETKLDPALAAKLFPVHFVAATEVKGEEIQRAIDFLAREKFVDRSFGYGEIVSSFCPVKS